MCTCIRFLSLSFFFLLLLVPLQTYIWHKKKLGIANSSTEREKKKFLHYCVRSEENDRHIKTVE